MHNKCLEQIEDVTNLKHTLLNCISIQFPPSFFVLSKHVVQASFWREFDQQTKGIETHASQFHNMFMAYWDEDGKLLANAPTKD